MAKRLHSTRRQFVTGSWTFCTAGRRLYINRPFGHGSVDLLSPFPHPSHTHSRMSAHYHDTWNSHLASYYTDMTSLASTSYNPYLHWPSALQWYAFAPPAPLPYGPSQPWVSHHHHKLRPSSPVITVRTPTSTPSTVASSASSSTSASSSPELVLHVVCTAPLVAPVPVPRARPALFECELPDIDEDLSHPPYITRPGKRKSSDVLADLHVSSLNSTSTSTGSDGDQLIEPDGGGRPKKMRRMARAPLAPRTTGERRVRSLRGRP